MLYWFPTLNSPFNDGALQLIMETKKDNIPSLEDQGFFYDQYWSGLRPYGRFKVERVAKIMEYLSEVRKKKIGSEILDLGCGDGRSVAIWNVFGKATGIDLSVNAVSNAKKSFPGIQFYSGDAVNTNFDSNSFDIIVSQEVLEHIEVQENYISECTRLLRDDGYLILTTPNKYYFDRVRGGNYSRQPIENILTPVQLRNLLEPNFKIIKEESVVMAPGHHGIYRILYNKFVVSFFKLTKLDFIRRELVYRNMLGLHICVLARKK
jgi:2-polyprenyl-3-methyl-5-hydroxy-6-metoxy-1,4-benzoquinol methylase